MSTSSNPLQAPVSNINYNTTVHREKHIIQPGHQWEDCYVIKLFELQLDANGAGEARAILRLQLFSKLFI